MRVAVVALRFPTLSETFILNHVSGLLQAGHDVDVYSTLRPTESLAHAAVTDDAIDRRVRYLDVPRVRHRLSALPAGVRRAWGRDAWRWLSPARYGPGALSLKPLYSLPALRSLAAGDAPPRYDVVHCHYGTQGYAYLFLRELFDAPLVTSFHGYDLVCFGRLGRLAYRTLFARGDAFVANSDSTAERLTRLGCPRHKIVTVPAIVDDGGVLPPERPVFDTDPVRLLTVARLDEAKGIQHALAAVRLLRDRGCPVEYTVVGGGAYRSTLEQVARSLAIADVVRFVGAKAKDDVYAEYRRADAFILPSVRSRRGGEETQGIVIHEAQLHAVPVIATRIGGVPESVDFGNAGVLCEPGDAEALTAAVLALRGDVARARALGRAGAEFCRRSRSKQGLTRRLELLYRDLTAGRVAARRVPPIPR